jgi:hypothetical protein
MKNIHVLPTDLPSRLYLHSNNELQLRTNIIRTSEDYLGINQHIYITNSEKPKARDWVLGDFPDNSIGKVISKYGQEFTAQSLNGDKYGLAEYDSNKIILTTDPDLIKEGIQSIDDEFLKWFIQNPNCERVEVSYGLLKPFKSTEKGYMIHLPDNDGVVEPKQYPSIQCDESCYYHCTKGGTQSPDCEKEEPKPHGFCETPEEKCTMNYCDDNGCQNRKRQLTDLEIAIKLEEIEREEPKQEEYICPHPERRKDYYRDGCFKCWECGKIVVEHNNFIEQGTLKEAAERLYPINSNGGVMEMLNKHQLNNSYKQEGFIAGVKFQAEKMFNEKQMDDAYDKGFKDASERMYSEEEVRKISLDFFYHWWNSKGTNSEQGFDKWFEQFKNKNK